MGNSNGKQVVFTDEGEYPDVYELPSSMLGLLAVDCLLPANERAEIDTFADFCLVKTVNLNHFRLLRVVGKGAFGKVRIVERKDTGLTFALKYIRKDEGQHGRDRSCSAVQKLT